MRFVFIIYWIWHLTNIYIQNFISGSPLFSKFVGTSIISNLSFIIISYILIQQTSKKADYIDVMFDKAVVASIITRLVSYSLGIWGLGNITYILICNGATIAVYFLVKWYISKFSNQQLNSFYGNSDIDNVRL